MRSGGKDLQEAYEQAKACRPKLKNADDVPRTILVSDFQNLHLYDETGAEAPIKFNLADYKSHVNDLDLLLGYERIYQARQAAASIEAANRLGYQHDAIKHTGYRGKALLGCYDLNWPDTSPEIFCTLVQHIMHWDDEEAEGKSKKRRDFGAQRHGPESAQI